MMNLVPDLPFGGIGASGMGTSHGHRGFLNFSHTRSTLWRDPGLEILNDLTRYPKVQGTPMNHFLMRQVVMNHYSEFWNESWVGKALSWVGSVVFDWKVLGVVVGVLVGAKLGAQGVLKI
jgi:hypothetical protein